jgi:hypothetical protein
MHSNLLLINSQFFCPIIGLYIYCLYEMFLSAKSILKGNTVDVYFYLQMGMVGLDLKKIKYGPGLDDDNL